VQRIALGVAWKVALRFGWRSKMRKKLLVCPIHGLVLHRCKRICHFDKGKWSSDYKEECFICLAEGRYNKTPESRQRNRHISLR